MNLKSSVLKTCISTCIVCLQRTQPLSEGRGSEFERRLAGTSRNSKLGICKTVILPVVLYGRGTWSLILRLRVFETRVLRGIFGPKRDEATGEWRKLHNEELRDLDSSLSISAIIKDGRACSTNGGEEERV
jgi:hypothetical protein